MALLRKSLTLPLLSSSSRSSSSSNLAFRPLSSSRMASSLTLEMARENSLFRVLDLLGPLRQEGEGARGLQGTQELKVALEPPRRNSRTPYLSSTALVDRCVFGVMSRSQYRQITDLARLIYAQIMNKCVEIPIR